MDKKPYRIVVLQRGWVAVGEYYGSSSECRLENASIIRRWGTTQGLGELAASGPAPKTVLDPAGTLRFHALAVVVTFDTDAAKWQS